MGAGRWRGGGGACPGPRTGVLGLGLVHGKGVTHEDSMGPRSSLRSAQVQEFPVQDLEYGHRALGLLHQLAGELHALGHHAHTARAVERMVLVGRTMCSSVPDAAEHSLAVAELPARRCGMGRPM